MLLSLGRSADVPDSNGSQIMVSEKHPHEPGTIIGSIVSKTSTQLRIAFDRKEDIDEGVWRYTRLCSPYVSPSYSTIPPAGLILVPPIFPTSVCELQ